MPIKDKDGTILKLRGPNPVMETQEVWDKNKIVLINMQWQPEVVPDRGRKVEEIISELKVIKPVESRFEVPPMPKEETVLELPPKPTKEIKITVGETTEATPPPPQPKKQPPTTPKIRVANDKKVMMHCLPIEYVQYHDSLYDSTTLIPEYGKKFKFEGVVITEDDLQFIFWGPAKVEEKSIIYPQTMMKRWWKVIKTEEKSGGYLVSCIPSDVSPDFSD